MLSIIIPLYNCESYIEACIESVLNQTFSDFEIIVVNDGSTDASLEVLESIIDPRIRIVNQENRGLFHARIAGLKAAKSQHCMFLDADDLYHKDALDTVMNKLNEGYDCVIYKLSTFYDEDIERQTEEEGFLPDDTSFNAHSRNELLTCLFTTTKINSIVCKAFDKSLIDLEKVSKYPRIASGEDGLFTLELFENAKSVVYLDKPLYLYRQRSGSISHSMQYNLYSDNSFRFNVYRNSAMKHFKGAELASLLNKIDSLTFRIIISMALNNRFIPKNKASYLDTFYKIRKDTYFNELCKRSLRKQKVHFRILILFVRAGMINVLWFVRYIVGLVQSVAKK